MLDKEEIRNLRDAAGLTQAELGQKLGVTVTTVGRWEAGMSKPSKLALEKLERFKKQVERKGGKE